MTIQSYRSSFLKRKNINGWVKNINGTPIVLDKMLNSFERKIKGKSIFTDEVKIEYFKGLEEIFLNHYDYLKYPSMSRKSAYYKYIAINFYTIGKGKSLTNNLSKLLTFKQFISLGLCNKYREF